MLLKSIQNKNYPEKLENMIFFHFLKNIYCFEWTRQMKQIQCKLQIALELNNFFKI